MSTTTLAPTPTRRRAHVPVLPLASIAMAAAGVALLALKQPLYGAGAIFIASWLGIASVAKFTTALGFFSYYLAALGAAAALQPAPQELPLMAGGLLLTAFLAVMRLQFFTYFTHTRVIWLEAALWPLAMGLLVFGCLMAGPPNWINLGLPIPFVAFYSFFSFQYIVEGLKLGRSARNGYYAEVGKPAPDFTLNDQDGNPVSLKNFRGERHVLLLFVRGDWCPHCHMMLRTYQKNVHRFAEKNILLVAIGPDPEGVNREMVLKLGLDFRLLSDDRMQIASLYGTRVSDYRNRMAAQYETEGLPLPASFLVDRQGIVRYTSRPDRVGEFLDPAAIFPVVAGL